MHSETRFTSQTREEKRERDSLTWGVQLLICTLSFLIICSMKREVMKGAFLQGNKGKVSTKAEMEQLTQLIRGCVKKRALRNREYKYCALKSLRL